jgi:hypothetical protein
MPTFRKKPVEIEAVRVADALHAASNAWKELPTWLADGYERVDVLFLVDRVEIKTPEGTMTGQRGDWIIQGVKGELYPCKPDIFAATYEAVVR